MFEGMEPFTGVSKWIPDGFSVWDFLNSNLLLALVGAVFTVVYQADNYRKRENENQDLQNEVQRSRAVVEQQQTRALEEAGAKPNFEEAAALIDRLKNCIESFVERSEGRYRRTYARIARYDYIPLIDAMLERNLRADLGALLREAFEKYRPFRNGRREVPDDLMNRLRDIEADLRRRGFAS